MSTRRAAATPPKNKTAKANKEIKEPKLTNEMCILRTGIRSGEWIVGCTKATLNTCMQVFFPPDVIYHPSEQYVNATEHTEYRDKFNNFEFFAQMTTEERINYCKSNVKPSAPEYQNNNGYLNDIPGVKIRLFSVGGDSIIDNENFNLYDELMDGELHLLEDFYKLIPGGSKVKYDDMSETPLGNVVGSRHSLAFRGSIWKLKPMRAEQETNFYLTLIGGKISETNPVRPDQRSPSQRNFQCVIRVPELNKEGKTQEIVQVVEVVDSYSSKTFKRENWKNLFKYYDYFQEYEQYFNLVYKEIKWFTPSLHKSLLQKLIRTRCNYVRMFYDKHVLVPAAAVLFVSFVILVTDGGSFVPDIRRFVRGSESAFKRIGVAAGEDTYSTKNFINAMLGAALAAQDYPEFEPTEELVAYAIHGSIEAQKDPRAWNYSTKILLKEKADNKEWRLPFYLLHTLGSFESDIGLLQSIGLNPEKLYHGWDSRQPVEIMPIEYCLDQHSLTTIAHFFTPKPQTFTELFQHLWHTGTGRNARKVSMKTSNPNGIDVPFDIEQAQELLWLCKTSPRQEIPVEANKMIEIQTKIDWSWMAGMLEKIRVKVVVDRKSIECHVFAHPELEGKFVAIRPASREKAAEDLSEDVKEIAIDAAKEILKTTGKPVKNKWLGIDGTAYLRTVQLGESLEFYLDNHLWRDVCEKKLLVPALQPIVQFQSFDVMDDNAFATCCRVVFTRSSSIQGAVIENWNFYIQEFLKKLSPDALARLAMYIRPLRENIEMYRISRDGTSTYLMTSWKDTFVFRFLIYLCAIVPGVLRVDSSLKFHILDFRVWSQIRENILSELQKKTDRSTSWEDVQFRDERKPYAHQEAAIEQIVSRVNHNRRGNLIWIPVGLGKTLIVTSVIGWLIKNKKMPDYCVYSLPPSAIDSIMKELEKGHLPYHLVNYTKKDAESNRVMFQKHKINLIKHDNMRVAGDHLLSIAPNCFFIVDEFHLTMNDTQRTSFALEMAKLAQNFIGLTGTLIKDKSSKGVIEWVSQVVEFEVNEKNYWVAIAALVSRKISLPIRQNRIFKEIRMDENERKRYLSFVERKFGGNASSTNFAAATKVCYEVIENGIIELVLKIATPSNPRCVFVVAKDGQSQRRIADALTKVEKRVFCVSSKQSITLTPLDQKLYDVVITTCTHSTGFTLTQADTMVTSIYFSNQATRDQLEGRILRVGQTATEVNVYILHTGILTYTKDHYEDARSLRMSMEDLAEAVDTKYVNDAKQTEQHAAETEPQVAEPQQQVAEPQVAEPKQKAVERKRQKTKDCPEGKVRNPTTGRCITEKKIKDCPEGKVRSPTTGRCITEKKTKDCPEGKVRNPITGRCITEKKK